MLQYATVAHAEEGECQDCKKGGKGGGGGGGNAAEVLMGLAAIMAAVAPMVAAGIQAQADKDIARTNANAQIQMTQINADVSKRLADQQKQIAQEQAARQQAMNSENQQAVTTRLTMQLDQLNKARTDAQAFEQQKQDYAQQLDQQRIDLAKQQFAETQKLANMQVKAQLTALGLSSGIASTQDSGSGLSVNPALASNSGGTAIAANNASRLSGSSGSFQGPGTSLTGSSAMGATSKAATVNKVPSTAQRGVASVNAAGAAIAPNPVARLGTMADEELSEQSKAKAKKARGVTTTTTAAKPSSAQATALLKAISTVSKSQERGVRSRSLGKVMDSGVARGSTAVSRNKADATNGSSDLASLTRKAIAIRDSSAEPHRNSFAAEDAAAHSRGVRSSNASATPGQGHSHGAGEGHNPQSYNPPSEEGDESALGRRHGGLSVR